MLLHLALICGKWMYKTPIKEIASQSWAEGIIFYNSCNLLTRDETSCLNGDSVQQPWCLPLSSFFQRKFCSHLKSCSIDRPKKQCQVSVISLLQYGRHFCLCFKKLHDGQKIQQMLHFLSWRCSYGRGGVFPAEFLPVREETWQLSKKLRITSKYICVDIPCRTAVFVRTSELPLGLDPRSVIQYSASNSSQPSVSGKLLYRSETTALYHCLFLAKGYYLCLLLFHLVFLANTCW